MFSNTINRGKVKNLALQRYFNKVKIKKEKET